MRKANLIKILGLLLATAFASTWCMNVYAGETLDRVNSSKQLVVGVGANWPPHGFLNDDHELDGFDVDVAKEIAKRMDVKVKFKTPSYKLFTSGRWHKRWDLISYSVTPTKARAKVVNFPAIYYYSTYVFVVHKDSDAKTRANLKDATFGVEGGTTSDDYLHHDLQIDAKLMPSFKYLNYTPKMTTYNSSMLPFEDLRLGDGVRLGAILAERQTAKDAIKNGYPVRILSNDIAYQEPIALVTDKGDPEFDQKIGSIVADMKADGTLREFSYKWFGADYIELDLSK